MLHEWMNAPYTVVAMQSVNAGCGSASDLCDIYTQIVHNIYIDIFAGWTLIFSQHNMIYSCTLYTLSYVTATVKCIMANINMTI